MVKQFFASIALACCMLDASAQNVAPTVSLDALPATVAAPGAITLNANAADADGTVGKVEFFNGTALLATVTQAPYSYQWTGVLAGTYAITARVTDNQGAQAVTPASTVTVAGGAAQVYYIYSDQVNAAKEIVNAAGAKVWQSDTEPFGANPPNENPAGQGQFTYNQRFPGQYFDRETGLHYNYHRDYDPQTGRYVQSDPIGLDGGVNTYGYVGGNPLSYVDPDGLQTAVPTNPGSAVLAIGALWWQQKQAADLHRANEWAVYEAMQSEANAIEEERARAVPVPYPDRRKGQWTCTCRVNKDGRCRDNYSNNNMESAQATASGPTIQAAKKAAEKAAKDILGAKSTHHPTCRCISPKGEQENPTR